MADLWYLLSALAAVVLPMALAWWLLGRPRRARGARPDRHGKIPGEEDC